MTASASELQSPAFRFDEPDYRAATGAFETVHQLSERQYWGNGRWSEDLQYRQSSRRAIGYLGAYEATRQPVYLDRAKEALEYLLEEQQPDGVWSWRGPSHFGLVRGDFDYYETSIAGVALAEGYRITGEPAYFNAAWRAASYVQQLYLSPNNNYNMFGVWLLARMHNIEPNQAFLQSAIHKTLYGGMPDQLDTGGWPGHNAWIWYHGIILRGMAELWTALPEDHPFRATLQPAFYKALNRLALEMGQDGRVPPQPGDDGDKHRNAFSIAATLIAEASLGAPVRQLSDGLMRHRLQGLPALTPEQTQERPQGDPDRHDESGAVVYAPELRRFVRDRTWGEMPQGWFNGWLPGFEPQRGDVVWRRHTALAWEEACLEIQVKDADGHRGAGFEVPAGTLTPGAPYRMLAAVAGLENHQARGSLSAIWLSAYNGPRRDNWDAQTGTDSIVESPLIGVFQQLELDFFADETTYLYIVPMAGKPRPDGEFGLLIDDVRIVERIPTQPNQMPDPLMDDLDTEVMAFGLYLKHRRP